MNIIIEHRHLLITILIIILITILILLIMMKPSLLEQGLKHIQLGPSERRSLSALLDHILLF